MLGRNGLTFFLFVPASFFYWALMLKLMFILWRIVLKLPWGE